MLYQKMWVPNPPTTVPPHSVQLLSCLHVTTLTVQVKRVGIYLPRRNKNLSRFRLLTSSSLKMSDSRFRNVFSNFSEDVTLFIFCFANERKNVTVQNEEILNFI